MFFYAVVSCLMMPLPSGSSPPFASSSSPPIQKKHHDSISTEEGGRSLQAQEILYWSTYGNSQWTARDGLGSVALADGTVLIMGGMSTSDALNDVWQSVNGGSAWTLVTSSAGWIKRTRHTVSLLPDGAIMVTGGFLFSGGGGANNYLNDIWKSYDGGSTWGLVTNQAPWGRRCGHTAAVKVDGTIVIAGGYGTVATTSAMYFNDVWKSIDAGGVWTLVTAGAPFIGRNGHTSLALSGGAVLVLGGYNGGLNSAGPSNWYNDVWKSSDDGLTWISATSNAPWKSRRGHTTVALPDDTILVLGGSGSGDYNIFNDIWKSQDAGVSWTVVTKNAPWQARRSHACVFLTNSYTLLLLGGTSNPSDDSTTSFNYRDVWVGRSGCLPGFYTTGGTSIACYECTSGFYCLEGARMGCPKGHYNNMNRALDASWCLPCQPGYASSNEAASNCLPCPSGSHAEGAGSTDCRPCEAGTYSPYPGTATCSACSAGKYSLAGSISCSVCAGGKYSTTIGAGSASTCLPCDLGTFSSSTGATSSATCLPCDPGMYGSVTGLTSCFSCPKGSYSITPASIACTLCSEGTYSTAVGASLASTCIACPTGFCASSPGSSTCTPCEIGKHVSIQGAATCQWCAAGSYSVTTGMTTCTPCPAGSYSSTVGATSSTVCTKCDAGTYSRAGASACVACPAGSYAFTTGSSTCTPCESGKYNSIEGATTCQWCAAGSYAPVTGSIACTLCPAGSYSSSVGATASSTCVQCAVGQYSTALGAVSPLQCLDCPKGTYGQQKGLRVCASCPPGSYSATTAATSSSTCLPCRAGYYSNTTQASSVSACLACRAGTYASSVGSSSCKLCPVGTFSSASSQSCLNCAAGTYTSELETTSCLPCPLGQLSAEGASACVYTESTCPEDTLSRPDLSACLTCMSSEEKGSTSCSRSKDGKSLQVIRCNDPSHFVSLAMFSYDLAQSNQCMKEVLEFVDLENPVNPSVFKGCGDFSTIYANLTVGTGGGLALSTWNYVSSGSVMDIQFSSSNSSTFHVPFKVRWECVNQIPDDRGWHDQCVSTVIEESSSNLFSCEGCDCCASNTFWENGRCNKCASPFFRVAAYTAFGVLAFVVVLLMIYILFRYGQQLITKHLSPLTIFVSFFTNAFTVVDFGKSWASPVKSVAMGFNSLLALEIDGALFNPKCFTKSINLMAIKLYVLAAVPLVLVATVFVLYRRLLSKSSELLEPNVTSAPPPKASKRKATITKADRSTKPEAVVTLNAVHTPAQSLAHSLATNNPHGTKEELSNREKAAKVLNVGMYLILMMYPKLVSVVVAFFDCKFINGRYVLAGDEKMECFKAEWTGLLPLIFVIVFGYCIGIIVGLIELLRRIRKWYDPKLLFQSGPSLRSFYRYTGYLSARFHPLYYRFEFYLLARKVMIIFIRSFLQSYSQSRILATSLVFYVSGNVHLSKEPFRTSELNRMEGLLIGLVLVQCACTLLLDAADPALYTSSYSSLQIFNMVFSYFAFYSVIAVGGAYAVYTWYLTVKRKDSGQGNESSSLAIDRTMGHNYKQLLNSMYLGCTFTVMALLVVTQVQSPSSAKTGRLELIVSASFFVTVIGGTMYVKRQSNKVAGLSHIDAYENILNAGEKLIKAKSGAEYDRIKRELLTPLLEKCRSCPSPLLDEDSIAVFKSILEPLRVDYKMKLPVDLMCALKYSNEIIYQSLESSVKEVNSTVSGYPAVHHALTQRNKELMKILLYHKADIFNVVDKNNRSLGDLALQMVDRPRQSTAVGDLMTSVPMLDNYNEETEIEDPIIWLYSILKECEDVVTEEQVESFELQVMLKGFRDACLSMKFPIFDWEGNGEIKRLRSRMQMNLKAGVDVSVYVLLALGLVSEVLEDGMVIDAELDVVTEIVPGFTPLLITICARRWRLARHMVGLERNIVINASTGGDTILDSLPFLQFDDEDFKCLLDNILVPFLNESDTNHCMLLCNTILLNEMHHGITEQEASVPIIAEGLSTLILSRWKCLMEAQIPSFDPTLIADSVAVLLDLPVQLLDFPLPCQYPALHVAAMQEKWKVMAGLMRNSAKYPVFSSMDYRGRTVFEVLSIKNLVFLCESLVSGKVIAPAEVKSHLSHIITAAVRCRVSWDPEIVSLDERTSKEMLEVVARWIVKYEMSLGQFPVDALSALGYPLEEICNLLKGDIGDNFNLFFSSRPTGLPACHYIMVSTRKEEAVQFLRLAADNPATNLKLMNLSETLMAPVMQFIIANCPSFNNGSYNLSQSERLTVWTFLRSRKMCYLDLDLDVYVMLGYSLPHLNILLQLKGAIHGDHISPDKPVTGLTAMEIALLTNDIKLLEVLFPYYSKYCKDDKYYSQTVKLLTPYGPFSREEYSELAENYLGRSFVDSFLTDGPFDMIVFERGGRIDNFKGDEGNRTFDSRKCVDRVQTKVTISEPVRE